VATLVELWCLIAEHSGLVGAWRLTGVCKAAREGATQYLRTLPGLVVCGGWTDSGGVGDFSFTSEVWRLDLGKLIWERMPNLTNGRVYHDCCATMGGGVILGGLVPEATGGVRHTASVEMLEYDSEAGEHSKHLEGSTAAIVRPHLG
jgi:hypothetical protein